MGQGSKSLGLFVMRAQQRKHSRKEKRDIGRLQRINDTQILREFKNTVYLPDFICIFFFLEYFKLDLSKKLWGLA